MGVPFACIGRRLLAKKLASIAPPQCLINVSFWWLPPLAGKTAPVIIMGLFDGSRTGRHTTLGWQIIILSPAQAFHIWEAWPLEVQQGIDPASSFLPGPATTFASTVCRIDGTLSPAGQLSRKPSHAHFLALSLCMLSPLAWLPGWALAPSLLVW